ncbi:hypothetical protein P261_01415 [Lachnospiraceae bacterium TWA4]|nr:hypothetical protein P261_01415 [Lachnospiraceae bacterium TWA4]
MNKVCKTYLSQIKSYFPTIIKNKNDKRYIEMLSEMLHDYCDEHEDVTLGELYNEFGEPHEVAHSYLSVEDSLSFMNRLSFSKFVKRILLIAAILLLVVGICGGVIWWQKQKELKKNESSQTTTELSTTGSVKDYPIVYTSEHYTTEFHSKWIIEYGKTKDIKFLSTYDQTDSKIDFGYMKYYTNCKFTSSIDLIIKNICEKGSILENDRVIEEYYNSKPQYSFTVEVPYKDEDNKDTFRYDLHYIFIDSSNNDMVDYCINLSNYEILKLYAGMTDEDIQTPIKCFGFFNEYNNTETTTVEDTSNSGNN